MISYIVNRLNAYRVTNFVAPKATLRVQGVIPAFHVQMNEVDELDEKLTNISRGDKDFTA